MKLIFEIFTNIITKIIWQTKYNITNISNYITRWINQTNWINQTRWINKLDL